MANIENLIPQSERTKEEQREIAKMGGVASGVARREKKLLSEFYAKKLAKMYGENGECASLDEVISSILARGDSASVSMLKEIREATEGSKLRIDADVKTGEKKIAELLDESDIRRLADES